MNRLEWWTAWRHLQARRPPAWLRSVTVAALYVALIGGGFLLSSALTPRPGLFSPMVLRAAPVDYAGGVGVVSLGLAAIVLAFCGLARLFNLLATIITFSVAQGCMALVLVLGLMSGLELDLRGRLLDHKAHLRIARADGAGFVADDALLTGLLAAPEVAGASPILEGEVLLRTAYAREGATLLGIDPARHRGVTALATEVEQGSYAFLGAPERIPRFAAPPPPEPGPELPPSPVPSDTSPAAEAPLPADTAAAPVPSAMPAAVPDDEDAADDGGWEDPAVEIPRLRAEGQLPAALPPAQPAISDDPDETNAPEEPDDSSEPVLPPILLGRELASQLGVGLGDPVQIVTPVGRITPQGVVPGLLVVRVAGVFFTGIFDFDRKHVYLPLPQAQAFQRAGAQVTAIEVALRDVTAIDRGKAAVLAALAGRELVVLDWREQNRDLFSAMFLEKVAMSIALVFVILVAAFGILATNLMSVLEKAPEIAILKTMGCSDRSVARIFALEGLCVGILGTLGGITVGVGLGLALGIHGVPLQGSVFYLERLPIQIIPAEVVTVALLALLIVGLSSAWPARSAGRLRPVDGLRLRDE
ncbi:ABC transporter permease [Nannocystis sp.]|uniref:ABC transporter permease n=2 Tax=Nannocystis sp. TaxID=1962667 RepID=UPI0025F426F8|nr:ABC transporter permease [Nannocystis sp.]MBK7823977.1 ABC transporter permease [Nannocystis sp.]